MTEKKGEIIHVESIYPQLLDLLEISRSRSLRRICIDISHDEPTVRLTIDEYATREVEDVKDGSRETRFNLKDDWG